MRYDVNYFKHSMLVKIIIIGGIVRFISSLFGNGYKNKNIYVDNSLEKDLDNHIEKKYSGEISFEDQLKKLDEQMLGDILTHSPNLVRYINDIKSKKMITDNESLLDLVNSYINDNPQDWAAYVVYVLSDKDKISEKNFNYINKAIELGGEKYPVCYISRAIMFGDKGEYDKRSKDLYTAKSLDYNLKYKFLYNAFGIE